MVGIAGKGIRIHAAVLQPVQLEYVRLFENYGFQKLFQPAHLTCANWPEGLFPENVYERVKRLKEEPRYRFEHTDKRRIEKYADDFLEVYNKGWAGFSGVKPIDREHAFALLKRCGRSSTNT